MSSGLHCVEYQVCGFGEADFVEEDRLPAALPHPGEFGVELFDCCFVVCKLILEYNLADPDLLARYPAALVDQPEVVEIESWQVKFIAHNLDSLVQV